MAMDFISSKNIFLLVRDTLEMIDKRVIEHGIRVGYILYKMLESEDRFEKFELADFVMLTTLHDIGAFKTDNVKDLLSFDTKNNMRHSIYGYLFMKYLSPMEDISKILLYHHMDYYKIQETPYEYLDIACYLNLAEDVEIYHNALGKQFDFSLFAKYAGTKYSEEAVSAFSQVQIRYNILGKLSSGEYKQELDELMNYIMFNNDDKSRFMEMIMYCLGFYTDEKVADSVTCTCICEQLGKWMKLEPREIEELHYAALLHDIGMLAVPREIVGASRKLTDEEAQIMRKHVETTELVLSNRMNQEVVDIACRHHERGNGTGYPRGLFNGHMTDSDKILQVADTMSALVNKRPYRDPLPKEKVIDILTNEMDQKNFNRIIVETMIRNYDIIMEEVGLRRKEIQRFYDKLQEQSEKVQELFQK